MPNEQEQRRAETHARGVGELALAKITAWPSTTAQVCSRRTGRNISGSVNMDKSLFCPTISDLSAFLLYVKQPKSPASESSIISVSLMFGLLGLNNLWPIENLESQGVKKI